MSLEKHTPGGERGHVEGQEIPAPWGNSREGWEEKQEGEDFPVVGPTEWLQRRWGRAVWALKTRGFCPGGPGSWGHLVSFVFGKMVLGAGQRTVRREKKVERLVAENVSRPECGAFNEQRGRPESR